MRCRISSRDARLSPRACFARALCPAPKAYDRVSVALDNPDGDGLAVFTQVFGTQRILDRAAALRLGRFYRGIALQRDVSTLNRHRPLHRRWSARVMMSPSWPDLFRPSTFLWPNPNKRPRRISFDDFERRPAVFPRQC